MAKTPQSRRPAKPYTAVIFVHGMGPQARHENLGQLLEAFEDHFEGRSEGVLRNFVSQTEASRTGDPEDVPFEAFDYFETRGSTPGKPVRWASPEHFRAYEAYWSPVTARGAQAWRVALWALGRLAKPGEIAGRSWREVTRLRIARLHHLFANARVLKTETTPSQRQSLKATLLFAIQRFRGPEGGRFARKSPNQPMSDEAFSAFAAAKADEVSRPLLQEAIPEWDAARLPVETLATGLARHGRLVALATLYLTAQLVGQIVLSGGRDTVAKGGLVALILALAGLAVLASRFLSDTFADVFIWNSNQDRDREFRRRREILSQTRALFEHVARDNNCKRLVIVAHSLGTAITLETLSVMGRRNIAREGTKAIVKLNKLSHLFTLGSPIDKIFYFFHTREGGTYRAGRLNDDLRGNLSQEPFHWGGVPRVRWLNFWDRVDIVSDPLFTPLGNQIDGTTIRSADIENHRVENTDDLDAVKAHTTYLKNPSVVQSLVAAIFHDEIEQPATPVTSGRGDSAAYLRAARRMIAWFPAAIVAGAILVGLGGTGQGLGLVIAPVLGCFLECLVVKAAGCARRHWAASKPIVTRAILEVRLLVTRPRGD